MVTRVILRDRYYIPIDAVDRRALLEHLEVKVLQKTQCRSGCPLANKAGRYCDSCPSKDEKIRMWEKITTRKGNEFIAVPAGDSRLMRKVVRGRYEVVDHRADIAMRSNLRWTGRLRRGELNARGEREANQKLMLSAWSKLMDTGETGGSIVSSPRTGKCVVAGTMIQTDRGYMLIEDLFENVDVEDRIGDFGMISVPGASVPIRGLHCRKSSTTLKLHLDNGADISGTPEHPIIVCRDKKSWCRLDSVRVSDLLLIPAAYDPVNPELGLTKDEASLMGHVIACTDLIALKSGLIDLTGAYDDYSEIDQLRMLLREVVGIAITPNTQFELSGAGRLKNWISLLLASTGSVWRAFISSLFASNFSSTPSAILPDLVARALHYHLLGCGVSSSIRHEPFGDVVVVHNSDHLKSYLLGNRPANELTCRVIRIEWIRTPAYVYDLMVPTTHSFITNGIVSHNTVMGVAAVMKTRRRALITASKSDFLRQFGKRFGELTNVREYYDRGVYPVVLVDPKGWKDGPRYGVMVLKHWGPEVKKADVILTAYQQFLSEERGRARIKKYINNKIGLMVVDETHQCAAPCFSRIVNRVNVRRRLGLTATILRKDGLSPVITATIGRTAIIGKVTSTLPRLELMETGITSSYNYKRWSSMETFLSKNEDRNRIIVKQVFRDLRENKKNFILLPVTRLAHNRELVRLINAQAEYNRKNKGEDWPIDLAVSYKGGSDTNEVLNQVNAGRVRVVVATYSMVKYGLDVQRWTHVYIGIIPTSNAPNVYQALNRVCTPYDEATRRKIGEKPTPIVRFIVDEMSASVFCFAKIFKDKDYGLKGSLTGNNYYNVKLARANPEVMNRMSDIAKYPKSYSASDAGVKKVLGKTRTGKQRRKSAWEPTRSITKL